MSPNPTAYLLLFRNNAWYQDLTPGEIEEAMHRFTAWFEQLTREGKIQSGAPLAAVGKNCYQGADGNGWTVREI